ncbi:MAG: sigma factor-like helix-turn-helix DNA-binding protein [Planctomycetaceae bacterium]
MIASVSQASEQDLQLLLNEMEALPEKYQPAVILCCLEGKTREEAAQQLGLSNQAVKGRLERGRNMLKKRLLNRGVGLAVLISAWQVNQSSVSGMVSTTLVQQTIQSCMSSVVWTAGKSAATTFTFSKGAVLMSISGGKKILAGVALVVLMLGGGTVYVIQSNANRVANFSKETHNVNDERDSGKLSPELVDLIDRVKAQEKLYNRIEMHSTTLALFSDPMANPQPGFDANPDAPTGVLDPQFLGESPDEYRVQPHHMELKIQGVKQDERFRIGYSSRMVVSVLKVIRKQNQSEPDIPVDEEIVSQEYLSQEKEALFQYDGNLLFRKATHEENIMKSAPDLMNGFLYPQSIFFLDRYLARPLSDVLAGGETSGSQKLLSPDNWSSRCQIVGDEFVDSEPVIVIRCEGKNRENALHEDLTEYFYLAKNRNYIPIIYRTEKKFSEQDIYVEERKVTSWQEIKPGLWYPKTSRCSYKPADNTSFRQPRLTTETQYEVVSLVPEYPEAFFRGEAEAQ